MILNKLYKRSVTGKVVEWLIEIQGDKFRTTSGFTDGMKTTSDWTQCETKSYCTAEEQALKEAQAIHRKRIELGSFENINDIDTLVFFKPMLAHKYEDYKDKIKYPVYSQPKLDGIRCIVKSDGMWTRNGKRIVSAPHIFESLEPYFRFAPTMILDGELYADKFANDFNAICSLVKKTKPTEADLLESKNKIEYHIYDIPSLNDGLCIFSERINYLENSKYPKCCKVVKTNLIKNKTELLEWYDFYMESGYEGQMIRLDEKYENKRSKSLLKHKSFTDEEYTILGVEEGQGNKTGMVGSFIFENKDGKRFNSSPKFNWQVCKQMWNERDTLIGKQATVKYFNLTPGDSPVPRFPYVTAIRDYE